MAGSEIKIYGRVRRLTEGFDQASAGNDEQSALSEQLEGLVAIGSSFYEETVKIGRAFEVHTTGALAAVVARPTTANMLSIWNGEPDGGRSLIIDRLWALLEVGTAAAGQFAILCALGVTRVASITNAALAINKLNGLGAGSDTKVVNSTTALDAVTGVAGNWRVAPGQTSSGKPGAGATPGGFANCEVTGKIIVPPGRLFAIHVMADVVGSTFTGGIEWHEKYIKLG